MTRQHAIAAVFVWVVGACTSKASQCDDVAAQVHEHGKTLSAVEARLVELDADASADALALAEAAAALAAMELPDERVAAFASEYAALLHETATVVAGAAEAAAKREREAINRAVRSFDALAAREAELVADFNAYCQAGD